MTLSVFTRWLSVASCMFSAQTQPGRKDMYMT